MKKIITIITATLIILTVMSCELYPEDSIPKGLGRVTVGLPVISSSRASTIFTCIDQTTHYIVTIFSPEDQKSEQISSSQTSVSFDVPPGDYTIVVLATNEYSSTEVDSYNYVTGSGIQRLSINEGELSYANVAVSQITYNTAADIIKSDNNGIVDDNSKICDAIEITSSLTTGIAEIKLSGILSTRITYIGNDDTTQNSDDSYDSDLGANSFFEKISFTIDLPVDIESNTSIMLEFFPESFEGVIDGMELHTLLPIDKKYFIYPPHEKYFGIVSYTSRSMTPLTGGINDNKIDTYEEDDTFEDATPLHLNEIQKHNFVDDPEDWVKVDVEEGYNYTFKTIVSGATTTTITLFDSEKNQLAENYDFETEDTSKIEYIFPNSGSFYLRISSLFNSTGVESNYTISYTRQPAPQPEYLPLPMEQKKWTVLVYMDADNDLVNYGDLDIAEMEGVGSTDEVNIVVLWDNLSTEHGYYYIEKDSTIFVKELYEVNMGDETTATDFIDWVVYNFPADHYMLEYWNHGSAVDRTENTNNNQQGIGRDDTNGSGWLSETEQKSIIEYFYNKINRPIDIVSYDACLMATAEIAYMYNGYANYLAASEEEEPRYGWDYAFLNKVTSNPNISAEELSQNVLTYYMNSYDETKNLTFSITDLSHIDEFAVALDTFCKAAIATGSENGSIFEAFTTGIADFSGYTRDLYGYMENVVDSDDLIVTTEIKDYAANIMSIISEDLIIFEDHGSNWTNKAHGLSITMKADTDTYSRLDICEDTSWDEFLTFCDFSN